MKKGFTLIELLVVLSITTIISGMIFFNFRYGERRALVRSTTYQLAQDIRVVQEKATSSFELSSAQEGFLGGYGMVFNKNQTFYWIFADENNDGKYNPGEWFEEKDLGTIEISLQYWELEWKSSDKLEMVFVPPGPDMTFHSESILSEADKYMIIITDELGGSRSVIINTAGLVYVND